MHTLKPMRKNLAKSLSLTSLSSNALYWALLDRLNKEKKMDEQTKGVEMEVSLGWGKENPVLFAYSLSDFFKKYGNDWRLTSKMREGFIVLIAERD
jgi:hypothetical protein